MVLLTLVGRLFEHILTGFHLPATICVLSLLFALAKGGLSSMKNQVGIPLALLIGWMVMCIPFSSWKSDSVSVTMYFSFYVLMWLPISLAPRHMKDLVRIMLMLGIFNIVTLLLTKTTDGRLQGASLGTFSNSEDLALIAVLTIPFWALVASRVPLFPLKLAIGGATIFFLAYSAALTGARAGLIAAAGMAVVYFFSSSMSKKFALVCATVVLVPLVVTMLPAETAARLATVMDAFDSSGGGEAMDSAASRHRLLLDSIRITLQHPLFGVGPGQFAQFRWNEGHTLGVRAGYLATHNAYTQISSENGVPGVIAFVSILVGTIKVLRRAKKINAPGSHPDWELGQSMATALMLSFTSLLFCGLFMANSQYIFWYLMGGLALALERVSAQAVVRYSFLTNGGSQPSVMATRLQTHQRT
jgi:putative inorganic carbon (hco3(-)) transporter